MHAVEVCAVCSRQVLSDGKGKALGHVNAKGLPCRGQGWHLLKRVQLTAETNLVEKRK